MIQGWLQIALTLFTVILITPLLGKYIANVFLKERTFLDSILSKLDRLIYKAIGLRNRPDMTGWQYVRAILISNLIMGIFVFLILLLQPVLPLNPTGVGSVSWDVALHTTVSFLTNTDQQHYSGETALSYSSQVFALGFLLFTSEIGRASCRERVLVAV